MGQRRLTLHDRALLQLSEETVYVAEGPGFELGALR